MPISGRSGGFSGRGSKPRSSKLAHTAEAMEKSTEVFKRARDKSLQMHGAKMAGTLLRACMFHNSIPSAVDEWILQSKKLTGEKQPRAPLTPSPTHHSSSALT